MTDRTEEFTKDQQDALDWLDETLSELFPDRTEALREEIARIAAPMMEGGREFDQCPPDRIALRKWNREGMCSINDATQDDAITLADALLPIITRERERAARDGLIASQKAAIGYRDHADKWHLDGENNPSGSGYCCLKTAANIVGAIGDISPSDIVKGMK